MTSRTLISATLATVFAGVLPAADQQLLNLVMPDAKSLAGVNVDQAKNTPFGQYILTQIQQSEDKGLQELISNTGFNPTTDVSEVLFASNNTPNTGLALARGNFNVTTISMAATTHGGAVETYKGATIIEDPKQTHAIAFLNSNYVVAGDLADVKAAIDRQTVPAPIPSSLAVQVNQWSTTEDAWALTTAPPAAKAGAGTPTIPGIGSLSLQTIQSAAAGVKFGNNVVLTAQAQASNPNDAQQLAGALQLLVNMAQMQVNNQNPQAGAILNSLQVSAQGTTLNASLSVPEDQLQQIIKSGPQNAAPHTRRPMGRKQ